MMRHAIGGPSGRRRRTLHLAWRWMFSLLSPFMLAGSELTHDSILKAYREAVRAIKVERSCLEVRFTIALSDMQAIPGGETRRDQARAMLQDVFLDAARTDDFVGIQTHTQERYGPERVLPPEQGVPLTQMGYKVWPEALEQTIRYVAARTERPIIVMESGIGTENDSQRIGYYRRAWEGVAACLADRVDIQGYFT